MDLCFLLNFREIDAIERKRMTICNIMFLLVFVREIMKYQYTREYIR